MLCSSLGARVNAIDNLGKTPLLLALEDSKFEIAEYLIKHGSDVNSVDDLGQSALLHITRGERRGCSRIIRILLQCGRYSLHMRRLKRKVLDYTIICKTLNHLLIFFSQQCINITHMLKLTHKVDV